LLQVLVLTQSSIFIIVVIIMLVDLNIPNLSIANFMVIVLAIAENLLSSYFG